MPKTDLKILEAAIKLEEDGRKFYLKASRGTKSAPARRLLASLADEELKHIERITEIHDGLKENKDWTDFQSSISKQARARMKIVFKPLSLNEKRRLKADPSNLEAIRMGMQREKSSYDFYDEQARESKIPIAKRFYERLKAEEGYHYNLLEEAYSYFSDSASWFVKEEGRVMEGG